MTVALNHEQSETHPKGMSKTKFLIDQYNWKEINFLPHRKYQKKFETTNKKISLNIFYIPYNSEEIRHAYTPQPNSKRKN